MTRSMPTAGPPSQLEIVDRKHEMTGSDFRPTPYASRLVRHGIHDRARRETGSPASSTSPMFDDWREGIHSWVRRQTAELVDDGGIRLHSHIAAVNSVDGVRVQSVHAVP